MRFWLGLIIGMMCGSGGTYLALQKPWDAGREIAAVDAGPAVAEDGKEVERGRAGNKRRKRAREPGGNREAAADQVPVLGAADRALVWRGAPLTLPPRQVDFAGGGEGRALDAGEVNQVIRGQSEPMLACIAEARGNAPLEAKILVQMLVDGSGKVTRTRVRAPAYLFAQGFQACADRAARAMRFPATGAPTIVDAPYDLF